MVLGSAKIISDIIDIGKKFIPDDKQKLEFELKMKQLEVEDYANKKGVFENAISCLFPLVGFTFVLYLLSNLIGLWYSFITGKSAFNFPIDDDLYNVIMIYLGGFFGKRTIDSYKKGDK